jgi:regulator of sirC expression with transglutaminase-like and TPR domain
LALDPNAPLLHRARGVVFERAGKAREAAAAYHRYAQLAPNAPDAQDLESRAKKLDPSGAGS